MTIDQCQRCGREIFIIDEDEITKEGMLCDDCKRKIDKVIAKLEEQESTRGI